MHLIIDREKDVSLKKQIYMQTKEMILNGILELDTKLKPSRELAKELGVSRNIVVEAYDILCAEGYTRSIRGSGIYVNSEIKIDRPSIKSPEVNLSNREDEGYKYSFRAGLPALDQFPKTKWMQCYRDAVNYISTEDLGYGNQSGHIELRKTISKYLYRTRGIRCHEDQIIVTSGAIPGFFLLAQSFKKNGGSMIVEDPLNDVIKNMLERNEIQTIHQPVDGQGIDPSLLPENRNISSILTTPSHQYPLGGSLSISRRIKLIRYARDNDCYLIEDDYDSEFRYSNSTVESLYELDPERVIYMSSFSKIFLPSLRLGYMVLPQKMIKTIHENKRFVDIHCPTLNQIAMKNFIDRGYLEQHLVKMKKTYQKRREILVSNLKKEFSNNVEIIGTDAGMHLVAKFNKVYFTDDLLKHIKSFGLYVTPVSDHSVYPQNHLSKLILGYGHMTSDDIVEGILILKKALLSY